LVRALRLLPSTRHLGIRSKPPVVVGLLRALQEHVNQPHQFEVTTVSGLHVYDYLRRAGYPS